MRPTDLNEWWTWKNKISHKNENSRSLNSDSGLFHQNFLLINKIVKKIFDCVEKKQVLMLISSMTSPYLKHQVQLFSRKTEHSTKCYLLIINWSFHLNSVTVISLIYKNVRNTNIMKQINFIRKIMTILQFRWGGGFWQAKSATCFWFLWTLLLFSHRIELIKQTYDQLDHLVAVYWEPCYAVHPFFTDCRVDGNLAAISSKSSNFVKAPFIWRVIFVGWGLQDLAKLTTFTLFLSFCFFFYI